MVFASGSLRFLPPRWELLFGETNSGGFSSCTAEKSRESSGWHLKVIDRSQAALVGAVCYDEVWVGQAS
jgi:hypothetical protein